jgi:hypothetical protein
MRELSIGKGKRAEVLGCGFLQRFQLGNISGSAAQSLSAPTIMDWADIHDHSTAREYESAGLFSSSALNP